MEAGVLTNLPYASNSFDLVFSSDVLEHIHEDEVCAPGAAAACCASRVRPCRRMLCCHRQTLAASCAIHDCECKSQMRIGLHVFSCPMGATKVQRCTRHVLLVAATSKGSDMMRIKACQVCPSLCAQESFNMPGVLKRHNQTRLWQLHQQASCLPEMLCSVYL